ncbi:RelA/SpoT family protein [Selenomonas sputigena ATCC 35185]|uniref:GTP diphosphokinase n=2 Tax=Selenomonas sputigena (strain ATCC 35185 / DSM 20758 / CCUG 44933 / VPI D19B-28) TaxID=546271 RepID=C9LW28_SELS3|nr:RelA/SpoT family protein [Selenomonas sputigena ATCC 35185]
MPRKAGWSAMSEMNPVTIDAILEAVKRYQPNADTDLIRRAYELADAAHKGQKRVSGEDYIIHPLAVAKILTDLQIDDITISAAILHDVVEDTTHTLDEMRELFGDEVAMLIDGVTKLGRIQYKSKEEQQLESYRKMFLAMAKDIRVIMIKLADRLHNMRTLKYMREDKQKRIARETIEIYAPLANRLGISNVKWELEDLCLRYLDPKAYYDLVESVKQKRQERQAFIDEAHEQIVEKLEEAHITAEIQGRAKHFYSIYKKMKRDQKDISEIYDLSALRVLVDSVKDCYGVLGIIHAMWKPLPGRFKDYIAMPKSNGYQSLHTTVICRGYPLEIQIRTFAMHKVSEYGVAAHWKYKEAGKSVGATREYDQKMSWLRQMVSLQHELDDPREYFEALKVDVFSDEVFVFTPKGDVVDLPKGSIPIDFAYRIHTEVGHHCVGAKVNSKIVPLEYKLKNGDIVSIITNKSNNGPSRDWLNIVASSETRTKIRSWFKKQRKEENIARGMDMMEKEAKHLGYVPKEILKPERLELLAKKLNIPQVNDLLASIGYGGITLNGILGKLIEMHKQDLQKATPPDISQMLSELKQPLKNRKKKASHGILVEGEGGFLVRLARCCNPIPGDPITGYITRGRGVSVHRSDCPNLLNDMDFSRVIEVNWDVGLDKVYTVQIEIVCNDKTGMLAELFALPAEMKVNISSLTAKTNKTNRTSIVNMGLDVRNSQQVAQIMTKIRRMKDVYSVSRSLGTSAKDDEL